MLIEINKSSIPALLCEPNNSVRNTDQTCGHAETMRRLQFRVEARILLSELGVVVHMTCLVWLPASKNKAHSVWTTSDHKEMYTGSIHS